MAFTYLSNTPLDKAREDYIEKLKAQGFEAKAEVITVQQACGRMTAEPV